MSIGLGQIVLILLVVGLLFGGGALARAGGTLGRSVGKLRRVRRRAETDDGSEDGSRRKGDVNDEVVESVAEVVRVVSDVRKVGRLPFK